MSVSTVSVGVETLMALSSSPENRPHVLSVWTEIVSQLTKDGIQLSTPNCVEGEVGFIEEIAWVLTIEGEREVGELQFTYKGRFGSKKFYIQPYEDDEGEDLISATYLRDSALDLSAKVINYLIG